MTTTPEDDHDVHHHPPQQAWQRPAATDDQVGAPRKRGTLEELYQLLDENLAVLD